MVWTRKQDASEEMFCLVGYGVEKSTYLLMSFEEICEFWEYWQRHGRGTILTIKSGEKRRTEVLP